MTVSLNQKKISRCKVNPVISTGTTAHIAAKAMDVAPPSFSPIHIDHWSLRMDTRMLLRMISVVMRGTGAS